MYSIQELHCKPIQGGSDTQRLREYITECYESFDFDFDFDNLPSVCLIARLMSSATAWGSSKSEMILGIASRESTSSSEVGTVAFSSVVSLVDGGCLLVGSGGGSMKL